MENDKKPKHFLIFKIIGIIGVLLGFLGIILVITGFGNFENNNFMIGGFLFVFGMFLGVSCLSIGFRPEITKMGIGTAKYIQQENKENLKDIVNTTADISSGAITQITKSINDGIEDKMFCKHCGEKIAADSKFCNKCGKEQ